MKNPSRCRCYLAYILAGEIFTKQLTSHLMRLFTEIFTVTGTKMFEMLPLGKQQ